MKTDGFQTFLARIPRSKLAGNIFELKGNTKNQKPITISQIEHTLKNPFYYGVMQIKGKLYPHKYPPLISKELFDKAQEVRLGYHKKPFKYAAKPYILRGLIKNAPILPAVAP